MKRQLRRVDDLACDIENGLEAVDRIAQLRTKLIRAMQPPELKDAAARYDAISRLCQHLSTEGEVAAQAAELNTAVTSLLHRSEALFADSASDKAGGFSIPETRIEQIMYEAQAIQTDVQIQWQRAKTLAHARRKTNAA